MIVCILYGLVYINLECPFLDSILITRNILDNQKMAYVLAFIV